MVVLCFGFFFIFFFFRAALPVHGTRGSPETARNTRNSGSCGQSGRGSIQPAVSDRCLGLLLLLFCMWAVLGK